MLLRCAALALTLIVFDIRSAHSASATLVTEQQDGETIYIDGEIGPDVSARFQTLVNGKTKTLKIQSLGGDALSAIAIGAIVHARRLGLIVDGGCLSACAHFIFMAAEDRTVLPNSLVLFHNTNSSMLEMLKPSAPLQARHLFEEKSQEEKRFYRSLHLPMELLYRPQLELHTSCYRYAKAPSGEITDVQWAAHFNAWMPPRAYIESMSGPVKGFWPETPDDLIPAFKAHFPRETSIAAFGDSHGMSPAAMAAGYMKITECS